MAVLASDLASAAQALEDVALRVGKAASDQEAARREDLAQELYELEAVLVRSARRLRRVVDSIS
jgi:hypothetical protein